MSRPLVLLVEDNPITTKMVRLTLESDGYGVLCARDGRTAIDLMATHHPHLVIQDLILPDVNGIELVAMLRGVAGDRDVPILAFSGLLSPIDQVRAMQAGFTDLLAKPVEPSQLLHAVRSHLQPSSRDARGRGRRIVLVNDDPIHIKLERLHLEQLGFEVLTAMNGQEALELARRSRPDALVSDVLMPGIDGFRLCLMVREDPSLPDQPGGRTSASYTDREDVSLAKSVGANALVLRTSDLREVGQAVLDSLGGAPRPTTSPFTLPTEDYTHRLIHQLERNVDLNSRLARRLSLQEAGLSIMAGLVDSVEHTARIESVLGEILHRSLDAAGVSRGAAYLLGLDGELALAVEVGHSAAARAALGDFFGHRDLLRRVIEDGTPAVVPSSTMADAVVADLLAGAAAKSMLLTPITFGRERLGVFVLASDSRDLTDDWVSFAKGVSGPVGQAIALARAFAGLEAAEERYRRIFENSVVGIYQQTPQGRFVLANPTLARLLGFDSPGALMARVTDTSDQLWVDPGRRAEFMRALESRGEVLRFEAQMRRQDGRVIWVSQSARAIRDERGVLHAYEGIVEDITQRKRAEESLRQAEKLAALGSLLAGVAHELNNPLAVVLGRAQLLQQALGQSPLAVQVEKMAEAASRCSQIVKNFLVLARERRAERQALSLNDVVRSAVDLLDYPLRVDGVSLELDLDPEMPETWGDPTQLHEVVVNLVSNAHQAMSGVAERRLALRTRYQAAPERLILEVADTGPGIPYETQARIFEPFFTTKPPGQGTGLGLSICQGIVTAHGGAIRVESAPGRGALFVVELPAVVPEAAPAPEPAATPAPRPGKAILVVDDESDVAEVLADLLAADGYRVETANDGRQALERLERNAFDLVVSDLRMPELDGPGLYREVTRAWPEWRDRFVFITGDVLGPQAIEFLEQTGAPSVGKPFDLREVQRVVAQVLARLGA
jgi:PAS domain S-box-containing protein